MHLFIPPSLGSIPFLIRQSIQSTARIGPLPAVATFAVYVYPAESLRRQSRELMVLAPPARCGTSAAQRSPPQAPPTPGETAGDDNGNGNGHGDSVDGARGGENGLDG